MRLPTTRIVFSLFEIPNEGQFTFHATYYYLAPKIQWKHDTRKHDIRKHVKDQGRLRIVYEFNTNNGTTKRE